jgi:RimJ/RimL family protein N-acetyltransferase
MNYLLLGESTERISFRLLEWEDFDSWLPLFYELNVAKFLNMPPDRLAKEYCEIWFEKAMNRYENSLGGLNVLEDKLTGRMVGQCGLLVQEIEGQRRLEIGYSILPKFWGKGYASEAAIKCRDYAFDNNFSDNLVSNVHIENLGSEKVAYRNDMRLEKRIGDFNLFVVHKTNWMRYRTTVNL